MTDQDGAKRKGDSVSVSNSVLVIITALFSGVIATLITIFWQRKNNIFKEKIKTFTILMSKRYDISCKESVEALNTIDIIFYRSPKVRTAWNHFMDAVNAPDNPNKTQNIIEKHLKLLEEIANDINYTRIKWDDIKHYYNPVGLTNRITEENILRKVQIDAALAEINGKKQANEVVQTQGQNDIGNQVILEAIKNPDGFVKLVEVAEKVQAFSNRAPNNR